MALNGFWQDFISKVDLKVTGDWGVWGHGPLFFVFRKLAGRKKIRICGNTIDKEGGIDMLFDFHTHTFFSDGCLSPVELVRRAAVRGYGCIGIADHVSPSNMEAVISGIKRDAEVIENYWQIKVLTGVELTHVPAESIDTLARQAKKIGAQFVVVHGETVVEPVVSGTNHAAVHSSAVDILAHPGFITQEELIAAKKNNVFIELTSRGGHNITNGYVASRGLQAGVRFIINSDAHEPEDLLSPERARHVARGAGLTEEDVKTALEQNPRLLLQKLGVSLK